MLEEKVALALKENDNALDQVALYEAGNQELQQKVSNLIISLTTTAMQHQVAIAAKEIEINELTAEVEFQKAEVERLHNKLAMEETTDVMIITENEDLTKQVQMLEKMMKSQQWDFTLAEQKVGELHAEIAVVRLPQEIYTQEIKREIEAQLVQKCKAREKAVAAREAIARDLLEEVKEGAAEKVLREEDTLTARNIAALQQLST